MFQHKSQQALGKAFGLESCKEYCTTIHNIVAPIGLLRFIIIFLFFKTEQNYSTITIHSIHIIRFSSTFRTAIFDRWPSFLLVIHCFFVPGSMEVVHSLMEFEFEILVAFVAWDSFELRIYTSVVEDQTII